MSNAINTSNPSQEQVRSLAAQIKAFVAENSGQKAADKLGLQRTLTFSAKILGAKNYDSVSASESKVAESQEDSTKPVFFTDAEIREISYRCTILNNENDLQAMKNFWKVVDSVANNSKVLVTGGPRQWIASWGPEEEFMDIVEEAKSVDELEELLDGEYKDLLVDSAGMGAWSVALDPEKEHMNDNEEFSLEPEEIQRGFSVRTALEGINEGSYQTTIGDFDIDFKFDEYNQKELAKELKRVILAK